MLIFNSQRNESSNTTDVSKLYNFEVAKRCFYRKRSKYIHIFIQGIDNISFRIKPTPIINDNNCHVAVASVPPTTVDDTIQDNQLINHVSIDVIDNYEITNTPQKQIELNSVTNSIGNLKDDDSPKYSSSLSTDNLN